MPVPSRNTPTGATTGGFSAGTRIAVPGGTQAVEDIAVGDLVETLDHGPQPVRFIRTQDLACTVRVTSGALGTLRDLVLAPHHRVLISDWRAELWTGCDEVLIAVRDLVDGAAVQWVTGTPVPVIHFGFDGHQIILADGCASESCARDAGAARAIAGPAEVACLLAA